MGRYILRKSSLTILILISLTSWVSGFSHIEHPVSTMPVSLPIRDRHRHILQWSQPVQQHPSIEHYLDYFGKGPGRDYLIRCLKRAEPYWDFIQAELVSKEMPREIIYLPLIESAYRTDAYSRSGAAGLWQFMMNSIAPYDITVDAWRDDRRDFWRSTQAALDKLEYNYNKTGDWLLALAAYNCGLNKMTRTVKASGLDDYWQLKETGLLPRETGNYIPKLAAVAILCETRSIAGLPLDWETHTGWVRIPLNRSVDLRRLSEKTSIPLQTLMDAHRELNYGVTPPPSEGYYLKIPLEYSHQVENVLSQESELISFKRYRIQSGDTLSEIAQWYKIPLAYIHEYNPGIESRYLRIGQVLLVPVLDLSIPDKPGSLNEKEKTDWTGVYTVKPGDSLWRIAMIHETSPEEIAAGNGMPLESTIVPGMQLTVPQQGE